MPSARRRLLGIGASAALALPMQRSTRRGASIGVDRGSVLARVPDDFVGLSYETRHLADPSFFSARNEGLITQFRALAPRGVLRLGGNTSDVGWWKPDPAATRPVPPAGRPVPRPDRSYPIEPQAIRHLREFLDAVGWRCVYGINLGTNTVERAVDEASFVARVLGPALHHVQLGNEPDLFPRHLLRDPRTWTVDAYLGEWLAMARAIHAGQPSVRFGLADSTLPDWSTAAAARLLAESAQGRGLPIAGLSQHFYVGGPPSDPEVDIGRILRPDARVARRAAAMRAAALRLGVPWRMTEGNTCFLGGKPGVSDVFAAALWSADYLLTTASLGYAGVHLHGGGGPEVVSSLGGTLPGESLMPDPGVPHARPFYTPIAAFDGRYVAQPVGIGMRFAAAFAGTSIVKAWFEPGPVNAKAFAATRPDGTTLLAIVNKDDRHDLDIDLSGWVAVSRLSAPSLAHPSAELSAPGGAARERGVPRASALLLRADVSGRTT